MYAAVISRISACPIVKIYDFITRYMKIILAR
jgi:hypothetical protein